MQYNNQESATAMRSKPKNFRIKQEALGILLAVSRDSNVTETDIVEYCVARYAIELEIEIAKARQVLLRQLANGIVAESEKAGGQEGQGDVTTRVHFAGGHVDVNSAKPSTAKKLVRKTSK